MVSVSCLRTGARIHHPVRSLLPSQAVPVSWGGLFISESPEILTYSATGNLQDAREFWRTEASLLPAIIDSGFVVLSLTEITLMPLMSRLESIILSSPLPLTSPTAKQTLFLLPVGYMRNQLFSTAPGERTALSTLHKGITIFMLALSIAIQLPPRRLPAVEAKVVRIKTVGRLTIT